MPGKNDEEVQWPQRSVAEFEHSETIRYGRSNRHRLYHQADFNIAQQVIRSAFQDLSNDRCVGFHLKDSHVHMKCGCLKDNLPAGSLAASLYRRHLMLGVN